MPLYRFPYTFVPKGTTAAFPTRTSTPRPILPVKLQSATATWTAGAIVDSGADDCVFPVSFASHLGLDIANNTRTFIFGGAGSKNQTAYFFDLKVTFGDFVSYKLPIGFSSALESVGIGLLGQNGFFENFAVSFDLANRHFYLEPK